MDKEKAYERLAELCSKAEYSTGEALQRLYRWGFDRQTACETVQRLVDERYIDDERFARAFVRTKVNLSRWGMTKARMALREKGIDRDIIDMAIDTEVDPDTYYRNLAATLRAKGSGMERPLTYDDSRKLAQYAHGRGYELSLVLEMIADEDYWRNEPS